MNERKLKPCIQPNCPIPAAVRLGDMAGNTLRACEYHQHEYLALGYRVVNKYAPPQGPDPLSKAAR
jgi:hypothetical protein